MRNRRWFSILLAAIPNSTFVEIFPDQVRDPMWYELVAEKADYF
jgi:hypothetical protein